MYGDAISPRPQPWLPRVSQPTLSPSSVPICALASGKAPPCIPQLGVTGCVGGATSVYVCVLSPVCASAWPNHLAHPLFVSRAALLAQGTPICVLACGEAPPSGSEFGCNGVCFGVFWEVCGILTATTISVWHPDLPLNKHTGSLSQPSVHKDIVHNQRDALHHIYGCVEGRSSISLRHLKPLASKCSLGVGDM